MMKSLVVDDDYVARAKIQTLLANYGPCECTGSGQEALDLFKQAHAQQKPYDLITIDINMPQMNGQTLLRRIRCWEKQLQLVTLQEQIKAIMVTNSYDHQNVLSSFRNCCDWYLIKPVNPQNLREALMQARCLPVPA